MEAGRCNLDDANAHSALLTSFDQLSAMLAGHAHHEDREHLRMLEERKHPLSKAMPEEHEEQEKALQDLRVTLLSNKKIFYSQFNEFLVGYMEHMQWEENEVMSALQDLYSDDELRALAFKTYGLMTPNQMADMLERLHPYINKDDMDVYLKDMRYSQPEKLSEAMPRIQTFLS